MVTTAFDIEIGDLVETAHKILDQRRAFGTRLAENEKNAMIEMAYYGMALNCGIDMMESRLLEESGRAHFMTRRFDRERSEQKHHIQTLCAMQHYDFNDVNSYSYEQLFQTMRALRLPYPQAEQMFRRVVGQWGDYAEEAKVDPLLRDTIQDTLLKS